MHAEGSVCFGGILFELVFSILSLSLAFFLSLVFPYLLTMRLCQGSRSLSSGNSSHREHRALELLSCTVISVTSTTPESSRRMHPLAPFLPR